MTNLSRPKSRVIRLRKEIVDRLEYYAKDGEHIKVVIERLLDHADICPIKQTEKKEEEVL